MRPSRHAPGEQVGPWVLLEPLGQGGFSEVWRARRAPEVRLTAPPGTAVEGAPRPITRRYRLASEDVVALKLHVHPEHAAQLRAEARSLAQVCGAGVVRVMDLDLLADPPWLALELLAQDLRRREAAHRAAGEREGTPPGALEALRVARALETFEDLLEVMARVHREGVVHGDLKPENVLFTGDGELRVADFGLSRRLSQRTATLSVSLSQEDVRLAGTLDYMAPEQRRGERPTTRSDVFALGVLLYELLTGRRPQGSFELPSALVPSVPPALDRAVACCLDPDPLRRFATAGAVLAFLRWLASQDHWRRLEAARVRAKRLVRRGVVQELLAPGTFRFAQLFVAAVTAVSVWRLTAGGLLPRAALAPALGVTAASTLAVLGAWRVLGPWLTARQARLEALLARLEAQTRTGVAWGRAEPPRRG